SRAGASAAPTPWRRTSAPGAGGGVSWCAVHIGARLFQRQSGVAGRSSLNSARNQECVMAKGQMKSSKETRKPKKEVPKTMAAKGMALKAIAKALTRSEESVKDRAKLDGLKISKLR